MNPVGLGAEIDCADEDQQQFTRLNFIALNSYCIITALF
jgi:hypothetical protein